MANVSKNYPWLTKGAVEFLMDYLTEDMHVLEYGCGSSTRWIAERVNFLFSIEHHHKWADRIQDECKRFDLYNVTIMRRKLPYHNTDFALMFDFILVDGRNRVNCFEKALTMLKPGGVIMLDNSERPEYNQVNEWVEGWEKSEAFGPDYEGNFNYENWKTTWWRK